ncbi:MAG: FAD-dependent oxidoreductase [Gammaproteobacteria bacterium]|nr:FAD-dependent oxidoreductase [Gammaproteobacteria bacterium]
MDNKSVIIIGAGLSGLYLTHRLGQLGFEVTVLEARDRIGGRILSQALGENRHDCVDLGPSWVWPAFQPRLSHLLDELKLDVFPQFTRGDSLYQLPDGGIERHAGPSPHEQSSRLVGGAQALVNRLAESSNMTLHLNTRVQSIDAETKTVLAMKGDETMSFTADHVVSAMPLRLLAETVSIQADIGDELLNHWKAVPTWMAGHCKMVFVYDSPFWRDQGLSGEVFSHHGPLSEIYDGSPYSKEDSGPGFALTSFVGLNAHQRESVSESQLMNACLAQLEQLFGAQARAVEQVIIKDWSHEAMTTRPSDLSGPHRHPEYPANLPRQLLGRFLSIAGTEAAVEFGGYIEGALESADTILALLVGSESR